MKIAIVTDSIADIPAKTVTQYNLTIIPSIVIIDGKEYQDGIDLTREDFYTRLPSLQSPPTTAAPPPTHFSHAYRNLLNQGFDQIVSIHVADKLSNIPNAAKLASKEFDGRITVVDSTSLTMGIGFQVLAAAKVVKENGDLDAVLAAAKHVRENMEVIAMLDTLDQLKRSGRVGWLTANLGSLLRVRLFVELKDGDINRIGQVRTRKKALDELGDRISQLGPLDELAMLHSNSEIDAVAVLKRLNLNLKNGPYFVNVTPAIGTHVGVNALGFVAIKATD